jgi:hypothetical protein
MPPALTVACQVVHGNKNEQTLATVQRRPPRRLSLVWETRCESRQPVQSALAQKAHFSDKSLWPGLPRAWGACRIREAGRKGRGQRGTEHFGDRQPSLIRMNSRPSSEWLSLTRKTSRE